MRWRTGLAATAVAVALIAPACGNADPKSDNTGEPTKGTLQPGGSPKSTPENMRERGPGG